MSPIRNRGRRLARNATPSHRGFTRSMRRTATFALFVVALCFVHGAAFALGDFACDSKRQQKAPCQSATMVCGEADILVESRPSGEDMALCASLVPVSMGSPVQVKTRSAWVVKTHRPPPKSHLVVLQI